MLSLVGKFILAASNHSLALLNHRFKLLYPQCDSQLPVTPVPEDLIPSNFYGLLNSHGAHKLTQASILAHN